MNDSKLLSQYSQEAWQITWNLAVDGNIFKGITNLGLTIAGVVRTYNLPQLRWSTNLRDPSNIDPQSFMSKVQKNGLLKAETTNLSSLFLHLNWGRHTTQRRDYNKKRNK